MEERNELLKDIDQKNEIEEPNPSSKISLIHVAQIHMPPSLSKTINFNFSNKYTEVAFSQYNVAKTILANPQAIILQEGLTENINKDHYEHRGLLTEGFTLEKINAIKKCFPNGFPDTYIKLTMNQKKCLAEKDAALVLFSIGLIENIYKTDTRDEVAKMIKELRHHKFDKLKWGPFYDPLTKNPELKRIVCDRREEAALTHALEAAEISGKNNILLIYGLGHDFSNIIEKKFKDRIGYEGRVVTTTLDRHMKFHVGKILPCGTQLTPGMSPSISLEKFEQIVNRYRNKYPSTSFFESGYRSSTMKALVNFLNKAQIEQKENISFQDIYHIIFKVNTTRATILTLGEFPINKEITATDRVVMDLY